jgi:hypothetical protein
MLKMDRAVSTPTIKKGDGFNVSLNYLIKKEATGPFTI